MKNALFQIGLIIGIILLFSSNKVFEFESSTDPIIGTWKSIKTVYSFSDRPNEEVIILGCFAHSRWTYRQNGNLNFKRFKEDKKTKACIEQPNDHWTGTWKKSDQNVYVTNHSVKYSEKEIIQQSNTTNTYFFSNNGNELKILTNYKKTGVLLEDGSTRVSEHTIFKRITE
jgi:hypothetical protein